MQSEPPSAVHEVGGGRAVGRVEICIPTFWATAPETWFAHVEKQFLIAGITADEIKFSYVVSYMEYEVAAEVRDILMNPPVDDKYQTLRTELIRRLRSKQEQTMRRRLECEELGDRKPSQFLRHLCSLAGTAVSDEVLRTLWMDRLPRKMRPILLTQKSATLEEIGNFADIIVDTIPGMQIASADHSPSAAEAAIRKEWVQFKADMAREIAELRREIMILEIDVRARRKPRRRSRRRRSASRGRARSRDPMCWRHRKFGADAYQCSPPCSYNGGR